MFAVIFEVQPRPERWNDYLSLAGMLRPELLKVDGFIDNVRYGSKRRPGWVLSLSTWRDEKALVRWRTHALHHAVQAKGRNEVFLDYHLRVGEVTADSNPPPGHDPRQQRLDETEDGAAKLLSIVEMSRVEMPGVGIPSPGVLSAEAIGRALGLSEGADGLVDWDVFEAILTPGAMCLLLFWRDTVAADAGARTIPLGTLHRRVRVVRDYGMFRRHEAPQYYPEVARRAC